MSLRKVLNVFRRRLDSDIDRELAFHLAERIDELKSVGMPHRQAVRFARRQFGNLAVYKEGTRDMDIATSFDSFIRNVRHSVRTLRRAPGFAATVILTLALGIGANSAVFSAIDAVLLKPLPFPDAGDLLVVRQTNIKDDNTHVAPIRLEDWNRMNTTFLGLTGYYTENASETSGEMPEMLKQGMVSPRFLEVLGISPEIGRDFAPQEEKFGGPSSVLISNRLWHRRFGADPKISYRTVRLGTTSYQIIGVMPAAFRFPDQDVDLWSVRAPDAPYAQSRVSTWYTVIGRLRPGLSAGQASADMSRVQADLGRAYPKTDGDLSVAVKPLKDDTVGGVRATLWMLWGSVTLLLLIACTNIAALLLARGAQRQREIAVRYSIGASRSSIVMHVMTETFILALGGAALGLLLASVASRGFRALAADFPRIDEIRLDWRLVAYALCCAVAATFVCGVFPAVRNMRRDVASSLNVSGRGHFHRGSRLHWALVSVQVTLSVALLAGAGLLIRSFRELGRVSPGFEVSRILTFRITSSWGETTDMKTLIVKTNRILDSLRELPGIDAAGLSTDAPPGIPTKYRMELKVVEGRAESEQKITAEIRDVSPSYFATMGIPLLAGEVCPASPDVRAVCVNRCFVSTYGLETDAIGRHLQWEVDPTLKPAAICGIVGDAREEGIDKPPVPTVYWCSEAAEPGTFFLLRTHGDPAAMADAVRRKVKDLEPLRSVFEIGPLRDRLSAAFAEDRLRTVLLICFAITALLLASIGLYGMLTYLAGTRRRELGLRLALGAVRRQILAWFLLEGLGVSLVGCLAGFALAIACGRFLAGLLYGIAPTDPVTLASVVMIMLLVAAAASLIPAVRASRIDPIEALRDD